MNLLIVAACEFASNTAIHPLQVAAFMQSSGVECVVSFRSDDNNVRPKGNWQFHICDHVETAHNGVLFADGRGPDLIHAWTPREHVRKLTERISERYGCPYIVHLEDNEEVIVADTLPGFDYSKLAPMPARVTEAVISPNLSHPKRYRWFIEGAAGVTVLIDRLLEFKPARIPGVVFWPGFDCAVAGRPGGKGKAVYGLDEDEFVMVYNGNIHRSNEVEVSNLIDAVALLRQRGLRVTLLKTGANHAALDKLEQAQEMGHLYDLGFVKRSEIETLLQIADVLVQPGHPSPFNDYRFPCKLPEFLATGKPVVLPECNLGRFLRDGEECLLMRTGTAEEIAEKVQLLLSDPALSQRIGKAGKEFANTRLRWELNLEPVLELYGRLLSQGAKPAKLTYPDPEPVAFERLPARTQITDTYLSAAVRAVAAGSADVEQREGAEPALYQKWLAASIEQALICGWNCIRIHGWIEEEAWLTATERGYAAGVANFLRGSGLRISDLTVERALQEQPVQGASNRKSAALISDEQVSRLVELYSGRHKQPRIGYASVCDYCDSADRLPGLVGLDRNLSTVQRPWVIKAILGMAPRGGRLLEIGAGEPWIADILSRAGYEVWVVDPYPVAGQMERHMRECPDVRFVRDAFSDSVMDLPPSSFDCVYSVSVLDKLDESEFDSATRGIGHFLKLDGLSIHAIDYVQRGTGHKEDLRRLEAISALFGIEDIELRATLQRLDRDLDLFTLSAESFNQLRGSRPYDQFRMRKWVGIQLVTAAKDVARNPEAVDRP